MIPWREILAGFAVVGAILLVMTVLIAIGVRLAAKAIRYVDMLDDAEEAQMKSAEVIAADTARSALNPNG